jgi:hypothetical protein
MARAPVGRGGRCLAVLPVLGGRAGDRNWPADPGLGIRPPGQLTSSGGAFQVLQDEG